MFLCSQNYETRKNSKTKTDDDRLKRLLKNCHGRSKLTDAMLKFNVYLLHFLMDYIIYFIMDYIKTI